MAELRAADLMAGQALSLGDELMLTAIRELTSRQGYAPTVRELMAHRGFTSPHTVQWYLNRLRDTGYVTWRPGGRRTLRITPLDSITPPVI